ncbi:hypothetical protein [Methyloglobulus sp.]|uniref:hypothetical protein n=1 Tax=Methyloglobulus sp. TaxID=2518622 RepID=UPI0032B75E0A
MQISLRIVLDYSLLLVLSSIRGLPGQNLIGANGLNPIKTEKTAKVGIKIKRLKIGWDYDYLLRVSG